MAALPPLAALRAFEAVARLGGFARAAAELNVTASAVSHQLRGLEEVLGARLLERSTGTGGISVTPAGQMLLPAAGQALDLLEQACRAVRGVAPVLTVSANLPFSSLWLARRLAEFSARHPGTPVNAIVQDGEPDFAGKGIDLAVVHVKGPLRPGDVMLLREQVFPVCAPSIHAEVANAVCRSRLLQEAHEGSRELDWMDWAEHFNFPPDIAAKIVRYSSFSQVVGAAIGGGGIALGRTPLIDPELESGRLVPVIPGLSRPASWCFALRPAPGRRHEMVTALTDFLRDEAGRSG